MSVFAKKSNLSGRKLVLAVLVLALLALLAFRIVQKSNSKQRAQAAPPLSVQIKSSELITLVDSAFNKTLPLSGTLNPYEQSIVSARAAGEVASVKVREGESVRADAILATLVATQYDAQVAQAQANVDAAKRQLDLAQQDYANNETLMKEGFIAKMALQKLDVVRQNASSSLTHAQNALIIAQRAQKETLISAPISGIVAMRKVNQGDTVGVGTPMFSLVNGDSFELAAPIAAEHIGAVSVGQSVELKAAGVEQSFTGSIERINPAAQAGSRSYTVYIRVPNQGGLRAGMFAQGTITLSSRPNVLSLPATAIHEQDGKKIVYVIENQKIAQREVGIGERDGDAVDAPTEIVSGLNLGDTVVRMDLGSIKPDLTVQLIDANGQAIQPADTAQKEASAKPAPTGILAKLRSWLGLDKK